MVGTVQIPKCAHRSETRAHGKSQLYSQYKRNVVGTVDCAHLNTEMKYKAQRAVPAYITKINFYSTFFSLRKFTMFGNRTSTADWARINSLIYISRQSGLFRGFWFTRTLGNLYNENFASKILLTWFCGSRKIIRHLFFLFLIWRIFTKIQLFKEPWRQRFNIVVYLYCYKPLTSLGFLT